jgi:uncharacterized protein YjbJ (UPF0337 family)
MSAEDKAKNTAGKVTGNEPLEAGGRGDRAKGSIKQAFEKVKDTFTK